MIRAIVEYAFFLGLLALGLALAASPVYSTIKGWQERSDLENTFRVMGASLGMIAGFWIMLRAIELCLRVLVVRP